MIYDEPTAELDPESRDIICSLICKLHKEGKTSISITNDKETIEKICRQDNNSRIIMLKDKKIYFDSSFENFMNSDKPAILRYLGKN